MENVKKIIADIKATKGNRKFCNGLAGTLQDDNYASSICKYVKTVTPERIDLLIEYAEKLEAEGWKIQRIKVDDGCYEVKGFDQHGNKVKAEYFPASLRLRKLEIKFTKNNLQALLNLLKTIPASFSSRSLRMAPRHLRHR